MFAANSKFLIFLLSSISLTVIKTSGKFSNGEKFTASDSAETSQIVEDSSNTDWTAAGVGVVVRLLNHYNAPTGSIAAGTPATTGL